MNKKIWNTGLIVAGFLLFVFATGCTTFQQTTAHPQSVTVSQDRPETGIKNWLDAVNQKNVTRLYDLSPDEIKRQISFDQFREENLNNTLLKPGHGFVNFTVINKEQNGTYSQIFAQVFERFPPDPENNTPGSDISIFYTFALFY